MSYTSEWKGNVDTVDGTAIFKVNGVEYSLHLDSFANYQIVAKMLDAVFNQGKQFAEQAIRSRVFHALDEAKRLHIL